MGAEFTAPAEDLKKNKIKRKSKQIKTEEKIITACIQASSVPKNPLKWHYTTKHRIRLSTLPGHLQESLQQPIVYAWKTPQFTLSSRLSLAVLHVHQAWRYNRLCKRRLEDLLFYFLKKLATNQIALANSFEEAKLNKTQMFISGNEYLAIPITPPEDKGGKASGTVCSHTEPNNGNYRKNCLLETNWSVIKFHWLILLYQRSFIKDDCRFTVSLLYKFCDSRLSLVPWFQKVFGSAGRLYSLFWWLIASRFFHTRYVWTIDVLVSSWWICWITILLHIPGDLTFLGS